MQNKQGTSDGDAQVFSEDTSGAHQPVGKRRWVKALWWSC